MSELFREDMVWWFYGHRKPMYRNADIETIKRIGLRLAERKKRMKEGEKDG